VSCEECRELTTDVFRQRTSHSWKKATAWLRDIPEPGSARGFAICRQGPEIRMPCDKFTDRTCRATQRKGMESGRLAPLEP
jgi:hypothetical protein